MTTQETTTLEISTHRLRELIGRLTALAARRKIEEADIRQRDADRAAEAAQEHQARREEATSEFHTRHARLIAAYRAAREAAFGQCEAAGCALAQEEDRDNEAATQQHAQERDATRTLGRHRSEQIQAAFLEQEVVPRQEFARFKQQCEYTAGEISALVVRAHSIVRGRCAWPPEAAPPPGPPVGLSQQECLDRVSAAMSRALGRLTAIQNLPAARVREEGWLILIFIAATITVGGALWLASLRWGWVIGGSLAIAAIVTLVVRQVMAPFARRQTLQMVPDLQAAVAEARASLAAALEVARTAGEHAHRQVVARRDDDVAAAKAEYNQARREQKDRLKKQQAGIDTDYARRRKLIEDRFQQQIQDIEEKFPREIERLEREFEQRIIELSENYQTGREASGHERDQELRELAESWSGGLAELKEAAEGMSQYCAAHCPAWEDVIGGCGGVHDATAGDVAMPGPGKLSPSHEDGEAADLAAIRFGQLRFALPDAGEAFSLPSVLSYPDCPSLLLEAEGEGREAAMRAMQNVMLRLVTSFPPGKVRFTIIDPVGLGQNFSAFMHLADYDERLVTNRIWTESAHINQRLADLTEHMENVIQKYLRNEFASIQEYNRHAGEVAEPFQILVIANFPANFSEEAARRLVSIASSGARCGVYTLISIDQRMKLPRNFDLADLEAHAATLVWIGEQERFGWKDEELRALPLVLDEPPGDDQFTQIVRAVGKLAKDAARVEVPFETVAPATDQWWTGDSRSEIEVPLGRAGATKKQYLRLGKGTSQHVLIAGKTGSGKSTLLNALITNLALHYSPQELEFYLIDFKKGVEFKAYAASRLPHARVIAIESEREFGMSVLVRLDEELKRRGDLFRKRGVQDVKGFRNADSQTPMPRVLLVIDEFQEFFTSDDKISHDAALLLDRLVRQGRAFGIHVLLGSQTLAGAYSLARSTIGQMAVRIALQCSESDAHLILSEDNTAARLLSRPGEAIYNDANGLFEGNHPFQIVWLPDHQREEYLRQLSALTVSRGIELPPPTVFEGNVSASAADNRRLRELLLAGPRTVASQAPEAWLGDAVAIKDPTSIVFRRQGGSNLLLVGQQEELALGVLHTCVVSVAGTLRVPSPCA
ncbi:MAG: FtsK/SpoIIIE domain-containing protein, partial [Pirellulaceae bacterium]